MSSSSMMRYDTNYPLYGMAFSNSSSHPFRIALSTLSPSSSNKIIVVDQNKDQHQHQHQHHHHHHHHYHHQSNSYSSSSGSGSGTSGSSDFESLASTSLGFPATKIGWEPKESLSGVGYEDNGGRGELIATSGDALRIFDITKDWNNDIGGTTGTGGGYVGKNGWNNDNEANWSIKSRSMLSNSKTTHASLPPVTSFSWNPIQTNSIVTCSIDTTATLWDINTSQALTQLIAHDRAVYDLSWLPDSSDIFVSVGADGSLRAFDLRQLEHSTILYESSKDTPLARIAFSKKQQHMMACFGLDDSKIMVLDMRSPGQPVAELLGHQAPLGAIAWGAPGRGESTGGGWLASCGDDSQLLLYDLTSPLPESRPTSTKPVSRSNSSNPYALSPPITPNSQGRSSSSQGDPLEILPVRGWTSDSEVNNLAFSEKGDYVGCVSGGRLNVLSM
ncbi:uncharacterized protein IL334_006273 [Kwoniella shivajii]|uniref:WD-repeat protein 68 n=1 Tax=Kwoniella shivajii TaxID=564305 RepID=A0ABZ1D7J8_9TREE|nr:hypothetical protein IL334_006273 [Kwoniella shivajii]